MPTDPSRLRDFAALYTAAGVARILRVSLNAIRSQARSPSTVAAVGRNAVSEVARSFMTVFPDMQVIMDKLLLQGDRAEYHWTLIGTNAGPKGTGHRVRVSGFELWQIGEDGLIASSQGYFDAAEYQRQLEQGI
ncbi:MAG TPA: ester cyclase [Terriglobales bacterium]|nr:ester cyclase [Terriglobales bacterium]